MRVSARIKRRGDISATERQETWKWQQRACNICGRVCVVQDIMQVAQLSQQARICVRAEPVLLQRGSARQQCNSLRACPGHCERA
jgi:hypothetical protein